MNDPEAIAIFVREAAAIARGLPVVEAKAFLRGALLIAGDRDELAPFRTAYTSLALADDQLELIAGPQMKLPLRDGQDGRDGADGKESR